MRTILIAVGVAGLLLGLVSSSLAQYRVYPIFELTDEQVAVIDVTDGSVDDWLEVVGEPTLTTLDFLTYSNISSSWVLEEGLHDPVSLDFRLWLAWHRPTSHIYFALQRADDIFLNEFDRGNEKVYLSFMKWQDSGIEIMVDDDHSGGLYQPTDIIPVDLSSTEAYWLFVQNQVQWYWALAETYDSGPHLQLAGISEDWDWCLTPPYADAGGGVFGENPTVSVTEGYVTAFDRFFWNSPEESVILDLYPGKIIGLFISILDRDDRNTWKPSVSYNLGEAWQDDACCHSDDFMDVLLLGPGGEIPDESAVESITWGRIKATFVK